MTYKGYVFEVGIEKLDPPIQQTHKALRYMAKIIYVRKPDGEIISPVPLSEIYGESTQEVEDNAGKLVTSWIDQTFQ